MSTLSDHQFWYNAHLIDNAFRVAFVGLVIALVGFVAFLASGLESWVAEALGLIGAGIVICCLIFSLFVLLFLQ